MILLRVKLLFVTQCLCVLKALAQLLIANGLVRCVSHATQMKLLGKHSLEFNLITCHIIAQILLGQLMLQKKKQSTMLYYSTQMWHQNPWLHLLTQQCLMNGLVSKIKFKMCLQLQSFWIWIPLDSQPKMMPSWQDLCLMVLSYIALFQLIKLTRIFQKTGQELRFIHQRFKCLILVWDILAVVITIIMYSLLGSMELKMF